MGSRKNENDIVQNIHDKIKQNIVENNLIQDGDKIVVAVSGGPDSMCLLDNLNILKPIFKKEHNINYSLCVAHVNHKIRVESEQEKVYVKNYCDSINVPFYYKEANVPKLSAELKLSEETCGRKIRYDFFNQLLIDLNANKLAIAHNLNDNVETILLNVIRGCGLKGLIGMNFKTQNYIRPMLNIEKKDILKYCELQKLNPCFDATNEMDIHMRNKVRLDLIPTLKNEYNENIMQNITRMRNIVKLDDDFLNEYTNLLVNKTIIKFNNLKIIFNFSYITKEHLAIENRAIRVIIYKLLGNLDGIENIHINDIIRLLKNNKKGKEYIIGNKFSIKIVKKDVAVISKGGI